ncbi:hypothetical protein RUM44_009916 [Polyplax serrata]|uniref:AAA+ ATPase domain-containing protein n=1 Tax=Polyplax serrata TaxID=468196 RepID=A0ABR1AU25_POLSC
MGNRGFEYLSDNKDKVYIDINDMVGELQARYPDYARRKRNAFKPLVERAFSYVLQQSGFSGDNSVNNCEESSENSSSEVEECNMSDDQRGITSSNNQIMNLYNANKLQIVGKQQSSNDNAELIDLSSDDEGVKKKDGSSDKNINIIKLNNLQGKIANKETTLTLISQGQCQDKVDHPNVTITAKYTKESTSKMKVLKRKKGQHCSPKQTVTFADFGGDTKVLEEVCKLILHISHPEIYRGIGISAPRGFLLHGPPGCGKTLLANAIAGELEVELIQVSAPELIGGVSGESEERIRELFEKAVDSAPCVLFIDEVDAITPNRQFAQREMERRIVAQMLTCLDELNDKPNGDLVLVIGATNRPDSLDPALRRAGRFDREVCIGIPDLKAREKILRVLCSNLNLVSNFSYEELAQNTPGFVGADLLSLTREAAMVAVNRVFGALQSFRNKDKKYKRLKSDKNDSVSPEKLKENEDNMDVDVLESVECKGKHSGQSKSSEDVVNSILDQVECSKSENTITFNDTKLEGNEVHGTGGIGDNVNANSGKVKNPQGDEMDLDKNESENKSEAPLSTNCGAETTKNTETEEDVDVEVIGDSSPNFTPTLETLLYWVRDSSPLTYRQLKNICITQEDFKHALNSVQPSAKREGFATVPDVTWDDVGSLADIREDLKMSILGPVKYRKQFEQLGLSSPAGILICGPPGCGKTLLAKAVANEAGINFISVKGPELLNMYVGESERAVRRCFQRARNSAPCVIFFDELDALCPRRSESPESGASMRVVNQLLTEMDGVEDRKEVYIMAATNRPDIIDPAVLRPGRLDKILYVGLPQEADRIDILRALTKSGTRPKLAKDVNLQEIAKRPECDGYSGADLAALVREAGIQSVKDFMMKSESGAAADVAISLNNFEQALKKIRPSVSIDDRKYYESIKKKYSVGNTV